MQTKQAQIKATIAQLEQWLDDHHPEDLQRPSIEANLQDLKNKLIMYGDD